MRSKKLTYGTRFYFDEDGNKFDLNEISDVTSIIRDMFSIVDMEKPCKCIKANLEAIVGKCYQEKMKELEKT